MLKGGKSIHNIKKEVEMYYPFDFHGKVVVVTGGRSGIGNATAFAFVKCGAKVVVLDIDASKAESFDEKMLYMAVDVAVENEVKKAVSGALEKLGADSVHILVNNAGIEFNNVGNLIDMPIDKLRRIIDVNLYGYINCARVVVPYMRKGGRIVNVSSIQGLAAHLPGTSYQVSKSGILGFTHALAVELASRGINVNAVAPGAIATEGMGAVRSNESDVVDPYRRRIPLGRRGWSEEIAGPILFLCSDLASYITGTTIVVDGGYTTNITPDFGGSVQVVENDPDYK